MVTQNTFFFGGGLIYVVCLYSENHIWMIGFENKNYGVQKLATDQIETLHHQLWFYCSIYYKGNYKWFICLQWLSFVIVGGLIDLCGHRNDFVLLEFVLCTLVRFIVTLWKLRENISVRWFDCIINFLANSSVPD